MQLRSGLILLLMVSVSHLPAGRVRAPEEVGFLDLATADRSDRHMRKGGIRAGGGGVTGLTRVPPFKLSFLSPGPLTARAGETVELVVRLENIAAETLAIPWEMNWLRIMGEAEEWPERYVQARLLALVMDDSGELEDPLRLLREEPTRLRFDGALYGDLDRPETVRHLEPGQWVRIRVAAQVPPGVGEGEKAVAAELLFTWGLYDSPGSESVKYENWVVSEPIVLEVLPAPD